MSEKNNSYGKRNITFCKKCLVPNSRPRITFDQNGICNACNYLALRKKINWKERKDELKEILNQNRSKKGNYDCIVPWSGGKDSSAIAYKLKFEYKMNPLLVTFAPLIPTEVGFKNRESLVKLGFDNYYFRPNQNASRLLSKRFFIERGDPKVHWTCGIKSIPLKVAIEKKIPLVFYAEHGESHYGGNPLHEKSSMLLDLDEVYENNIGDDSKNWVDGQISQSDIQPYLLPEQEELEKAKIKPYFFAYFDKWNVQANYEFIKKKINFTTHPKGRTPGTFTNFDSLDDHIDQVYYYMQYIKFGFGRATRDASRQIQNDLINKKEYLEYVKKYDSEVTTDDILHFCSYADISLAEFPEIVDKHRNSEIWKKTGNGWELKFNLNNENIINLSRRSSA